MSGAYLFWQWLWSSRSYTCTHDKRCATDEVCYFISLAGVSLQDMIKAEAYHRPIRVSSANTERRSKIGLHYMTATGIESNWIPLLVWAHPLMGLCIKQDIIIARMVLLVSAEVSWPNSWISAAGSTFFIFSFSNNAFKLCIIIIINTIGGLNHTRQCWDASYIMNAATTLKVTADTTALVKQWHKLSHLIQTHYLMDEANLVKILQCCAWCKAQENKILAKVDYRLLCGSVPQTPLMWHSVWHHIVSSEAGVQVRFQQGHINCKFIKQKQTKH